MREALGAALCRQEAVLPLTTNRGEANIFLSSGEQKRQPLIGCWICFAFHGRLKIKDIVYMQYTAINDPSYRYGLNKHLRLRDII